MSLDPEINAKRRTSEAKMAAVVVINARRDFQVNTTLYGGIEDITDNTKGVAVGVNASRLIFYGGKLVEISSAVFEAEAAKMDLDATIDSVIISCSRNGSSLKNINLCKRKSTSVCQF